ncbi:MAG: serine hydrolase [Methylophilaceae bacterium]
MRIYFALLIFFTHLDFAFADHQLYKSDEEVIAIHNYRMVGIRKEFDNLVIKSLHPVQKIERETQPNLVIRKLIKNSDLLSVIYFDGNEIKINEYSSEKMQKDELIYSMSIAKSFVSYLLGNAICDGLVSSLDDPIDNYVQETRGTLYNGTSLRNIINMSAGDAIHFDNNSLKTYAMSVVVKKVPIATLLEQLKNKPKSNQSDWIIGFANFFYSNILTDLIAKAIDEVTPDGFAKYFQQKISDPAGFSQDVVFLKDANDWIIGFAFLYASRSDYVNFGKLIARNWKSDSCVGQYLRDIYEHKVPTNKMGNDYKSYAGFFWTDKPKFDFKHLSMHGHGGQRIIINLETGEVLATHSIRRNFDTSLIEEIMSK